MPSGAGYRSFVYRRYGSFQEAVAPALDPDRWCRAYRHYRRGWLPARRDAAIVDIGCGDGRLLRLLLRDGYRNLTGVELSAGPAALARGVLPGVVEGDGLAYLEGRAAEFDVVLALDVVEHLQKDEALRFLSAASGALKSGGRLILQAPNAASPFGMAVQFGDLTHESCFTPGLLGWLMQSVGLTAVHAREVGPVPRGYSAASTLRWGAWRLVRLAIKGWSLAETGRGGGGVYTRDFLIAASKG
jgi:SAM-dependent methyltransferase